MNKRGTDKVISIYWFAVLFIVAAGIAYMTIIFYGSPYDVREIEANILINSVADCIATGGRFNSNWESLSNDNFLKKCHLNFGDEKSEEYYTEINYYNFDTNSGIDLNSRQSKISVGNLKLVDSCKLKGRYMPKCAEKKFYVLEGNNKKVVEIKTIINKVGKNVQ